MYSASDLRKGLKIEIEGAPFVITDFTFTKPGKGQAIYTCKLKNLVNGGTLTKQYRSADKVDKPQLHQQTLTYSYPEGDDFVFMDENYEQVTISGKVLGGSSAFLGEDTEVAVLFHNGLPIEITLPNFIERSVVQTEPGARGNTATNVLKPATVEGGYVVHVPIFIEQGDVVKIDTRTGEYADRVAKA